MARLDESRPSSEVLGVIGVKFEQDGAYYNSRGYRVNWQGERLDPDEESQVIASGHENAAPDTLDGMHWRHLKAMVESYGGTWTNKAEAIRFLSGS